jgi:hypothetical protein
MEITEQLDSNWLAWAAGFIDGEGSIQIARSRKPKPEAVAKKRLWNPQIYLYMRANQVDPRPLERLRDMFGGSLMLRQPRKTGAIKGQQPQWVWTVSGPMAYAAVKLMRPWFMVKGERADIAMSFHELCYASPGANTRCLRPNGSPGRLTDEQVALRQDFYLQMQALQMKGPTVIQ